MAGATKDPNDANPQNTDNHQPSSSNSRLSDTELMRIALDEATRGMTNGEGGPFGAVVARDGVIISRGHNRVLQTNDPTAHAEVVAIRDACAKLGTFSLHDCVLYSSCEPCPMCYSAVHWSKLPKCYFAATADDAASVGFDDRFIYDAIRGKTDQVKCEMIHVDCVESKQPFDQFASMVNMGDSSLY